MPVLWQFNLHYFDYLHLLQSQEQVEICWDWIENNSVGRGTGWHPYPTSLRLINWCRAGFQQSELLESIYEQSAYLYRNLETYVYGNHLLENARALVLAGMYLRGQGEANQWLERGLALYRKETPEQILEDGFHFERSPMYHALVLEGYLDVLNVLPDEHPDRQWLESSARDMTDVLISIVHPDGTLALFNDATQEIALPPSQLLRYSREVLSYEPTRGVCFSESGYFVHRDDELFLMIDGGAPGPEYLMAHAHADIFSYELSVREHRFIVDTGVYEYAAGPMRQYVRSTTAHNTVCVDQTDQIECWNSFRVARRFTPGDVSFTTTGEDSRFEGRFDGYATLIGDNISHQRRIRTDRNDRSITVEDEVRGQGKHSIESSVHLHPDVVVDEEQLQLTREGVTCKIAVEKGTVRWKEGWYCPQFGVRRRNKVLVLGEETSLPTQIAYSVRY
jgi:uncharacterized heparinase superfamily protein